jgi:hypothetical protein
MESIGRLMATAFGELALLAALRGAAPLARERVLGIDPAIGVSTARGGHLRRR